MMPYLLLVLLSVFIVSCAQQAITEVQSLQEGTRLSSEIGEWTNLHKGSDKLAGVIVNQYPDNFEASAYESRHPAMIMYFMWDSTIHEVYYNPDGTQSGEHWSKVQDNYKHVWSQVDFSHGSDPAFLRHNDPRSTAPE